MRKAPGGPATCVILALLASSAICNVAGAAEVSVTSVPGGVHSTVGIRRRASVTDPTATATTETSLSTTITPDGKTCIESDGYSDNNDFEALWVEFDYQLETPRFVQASFNEKDRIKAVEQLVHETLETELLGCQNTDNENSSAIAAMPRTKLFENGVLGMNLVAGISNSPTDAQVAVCKPRGIMNECRHMRGFVVVLLQNSGSSSEEARVQVHDETVRIIIGAMESGEYNGIFVNDMYIASITPFSPVPESVTIEGESYEGTFDEDGTTSSAASTRTKMNTGKAYGIIFMAGVAVISSAAAFFITKAYRDGRRRGYVKKRPKKNSHRGEEAKGEKTNKVPTWDTGPIAEVETESDDDVEVTLWIRSPRNASDRKAPEAKQKPIHTAGAVKGDSGDDLEMALHVLSPRNSQRKAAALFNPSLGKKSTDGKEDEGTAETMAISRITGSIGCLPIYEDEMEV